ncbi:hypothetical protein DFP73DRAFT_588307, partial [Morchella snyderi]
MQSMVTSIPLVPVERNYLDALVKKAAAWDKYHTKSGENSHLFEDLCLAVRLNDKIDRTWTVPLAQTIIVTNLPLSIGGAKLMNSFRAVHGIRCYQMFTVPGSVPHTTALIAFVTPTCAKEYLSYVSEHGFFLSESIPSGNAIGDTQDGRTPHVIVKPWLGPGKTDGKFITGNEGGYCNVSREIEKEGATRSLRIIPEIEPKELQRTLSYLATELKAFSGPDGRIVTYVRSPIDKPIETLGWHRVSKPKPIEILSVDSGMTPDIAEANDNMHKILPKNDLCPFVAVGELGNYRSIVKHSVVDESDIVVDDQEISSSLAKEALLSSLSASSNRICFTSLPNMPGDHSPLRPRPEIHPAISPIVDELLSPSLETKACLSDEIDRGSESYRHQIITAKEAENKTDIYLTEIHQSSR